MAQVASSVKIELYINKTLNEFKTAMDKQSATVLKAMNAESASFNKDIKDAITAIVGTGCKVATVGVNPTGTKYYEAVAKISSAITESSATFKESSNPEVLAKEVSAVVNAYKTKFEEAILVVKDKVKEVITANSKTQGCIEKALKDGATLSTVANKNITAVFATSIKNFSAKAKISHGFIKNNVTVLTKAVDYCISKKKEEVIYLCLEGILTEEDTVLAIIGISETEVVNLYAETHVDLAIREQDVATINAKKDEIIAKITACAPELTTVAPGVGVGVGVGVTIKA